MCFKYRISVVFLAQDSLSQLILVVVGVEFNFRQCLYRLYLFAILVCCIE
jgi:hypothetical protein